MSEPASLTARLVRRFFSREIERQIALAVRALDDPRDRPFSAGLPRDRVEPDRREVMAEALTAWRVNPLARRIVDLTSQYVAGGGLAVECKHERTNDFLQEWWRHRLNRLAVRAHDWCDELTRTGNLFILLTTDASGMSYLRAIPTEDIQEIQTSPHDLEQELTIWEKPRPSQSCENTSVSLLDGVLRGPGWKVYDANQDTRLPDGSFEPVIFHYAVNRPIGALWGESDLGPLLRWLGRYASWLEDRARLNRYRNTFIFWVRARFQNKAERLQRQAELNLNPPNPGSILVSDESENWSVLTPNLASFEAAADGLALKKMIAVGSGNPLHYLAEPESSTRTTAESAGGPTFRHYEKRQEFFLWLLSDLAAAAVRRRSLVDRRVSPRLEIQVRGADLSARDNAALATAASTIVGSFSGLRDRGLIDDAEFLRIAYRFAGEVIDVEGMLARGRIAPLFAPNPAYARHANSNGRRPGGQPTKVDPLRIDPLTGDLKGEDKLW